MPTDKKITELPIASSVSGSDASVLVNGNTDYQYTFTLLLQYLQANLATGANISFGTILPQNTFGKNGDVFVNTGTGAFAQKISDTWTIVYTPPDIDTGDGTVIYGSGVPGSTTGKNSDSYINTLTGVFYKKSSGTWSQVFSMATGPQGPQGTAGINGTNGENGNTVLFGTTNPSNTLNGVNGDFYINTSTYTLFGPKTAGVWGTSISLSGVGVPAGGTSGQILKKTDNEDFNTDWTDFSFGNIEGNPSDNASLASALDLLLPNSGGTITGDLQLSTMPVNATSAITKGYADNLFTGLSWKQEVSAGTTSNITLSGTQVVDGVALNIGDRALVKTQTTQTQNGIYTVSSGSWSRSSDADTSGEIGSATVLVRNGTVNKNTQWTCTNSTDPIVGADNITFGQISGAGTYTNGTGLLLSGNIFSLDTGYANTNYVRYSGGSDDVVLPSVNSITAGGFGTYSVGGGAIGISGNAINSTGSLGLSATTSLNLSGGGINLSPGSGQAVTISNGTPGVQAEMSANGTLYRNNGFFLFFGVPTLTANRGIGLPDANGTIALTSDIPSLGSYIQNILRTGSPQSASGNIDGTFSIQDGSVDINTQYDATSGATISTKWLMAIAITTDPTVLGNHAFSDMTNFYKNIDGTGHASYDARFTVTGSGNNSHTVAFQDGTSYQSTGTITNLYGIILAPNVQGPVTNRKAVYINNAGVSGSGSIVSQYGIYMEPLTSATSNWTLFTKGTAKMHHEGDIELLETTGTIGSGRNVNFYTGSGTPVASIVSAYQSTTQGDLIFNGKNASGTSLSSLVEIARIRGGSTPGLLVTGNYYFTNTLASTSQLIVPAAATSGSSNPLSIQPNINNVSDTDGGPAINLIPAANGTGTSSGGRINITAYSAETGSLANTIRFFNRSGSGTVSERMRMAGDGGIAIGVASVTTEAYLTLGASTTAKASLHINNGVDPSSPIGGDIWFKTAGLFYYDGNIQQIANLNGTQTFTKKTIGDKVRITTGTNASVGSATLAAGTVTVNTTAVTSGSIIFFTVSSVGGTAGTLSYTITPGTSFTIISSSSSDTSTIGYIIIN